MYQQAFILDAPVSNSPVITAAQMLSEDLAANVPITRERISHVLTSITGGSDADRAWSLADGQTAVEIAMLLWLQADHRITPSSQAREALEYFQNLDGSTPRPYNRTEEQVRLQQFSTPLGLAWLAARAAALTPSDIVLEPSAGTGQLAYWAKTCGAKLALNEIDPVRCEALQLLLPGDVISRHDGELIDELLDPSIVPTVLLINPPFSVGLERGIDGHTGARHLRSGLMRLAVGGRAVAIMPEWFDAHAFMSPSRGGSEVARCLIVMEGLFRIGKRKAHNAGSGKPKSGVGGYRRTEQQRIYWHYRQILGGESVIRGQKCSRADDSSQNRKTFMFF
jgi:hypothetical protein